MLYLKGTPKSGTTWLEVICNELVKEACALCDGTVNGSARHVQGALCSCARSIPFTIQGKHRGPGLDAIVQRDAVHVTQGWDECVHAKGSASIPLCMRRLVPKTVFSNCSGSCADRYLLIERNPIGVAVSWRHYSNSKISVQELCRGVAMNMAARHVMFLQHTGGSTEFLSYERLVSDPVTSYKRIATALNVSLSEDSIAAVMKRTSFASMQLLEKHHSIPGPNRYGAWNAKVRAGGDNWLQEVTPTDVLQCMRAMRLHLPVNMYSMYA